MKNKLPYDTALGKLNAYIAANNMRHTTEREMVLNEICVMTQPFTAEQLAEHCRPLRLSQGTVYNSLALFVSARILYKLERTKGVISEQYKWALDAKDAMRIICTRCGREAHFTDKAIQQIVQNRKYANFVPAHFSLTIYGVCKTCRRLLIRQNKK